MTAHGAAARAFREDWGRAVAALARLLGDLDAAEEAVQEAFAIALERWPRDGVPDVPSAWLITTARNRAIDRIRRAAVLAEKTALLARLQAPDGAEEDEEEGRWPTTGCG